ncbi:pyrophosphatase [Thermotoga maritima MSB8]|uniref:Nucleoside triphosphate pyrophosphohydrolase/pyrophosphatase MazG n=1 Tax=Thermotoga maritima (strain ATCC 43589 / DSM 3109 / JCM 10099 / NBRC 100826 / MSB8) TaxID=243274 RepID=MAZG_THEMA|nr:MULTISPECIES: nucleoside triphosphate pyrophosphohydrolase [Thermotoga]Q9X015.1 RecName: Full=Nucleoside triphosphate pyrophosphohydrolase/pyrophosphatase MazG; Short=NTP-PPase [Thermotoga maritima MSB8]AAD35994.1 mazG protein [Thermotoga maritima MSB8]AGL49840.1 Nucleoside triphosphate pyrophosphohydrolase MazG [Thermotoga maritima MSB8]AHD17334.1 nucleoside triphosphate pyrophosphohydrolase [Thermotoga maritima MSB8]AIY85566.1 nucleotide pyrophosphohydrolase [Thermotoga sp. 2812B]AKE2682
MKEAGILFEELVSIMEKLRSPEGCEWDRKQTHESLKPYLIEECYELIEAIDEKNDDMMKEELGDVLLQVVFHAQIARERGAFTIEDVIRTLNEKLIRRHPHVFGDSPGYSYKQWEDIKAQEKGKKKSSRIGEINPLVPALSMARRIQENASQVGFDWKDPEGVYEKIEEELKELKEAKDPRELEEEFGDLLFSIVNLSRFLNVDPESALRKATRKFVERFKKMEELIEKDGLVLEELPIEKLDEYWEKAKGGDET